MRIGILGTTCVDGADTLPRRERVLLATLVLDAPDAVSTGRLADALWAGEPPATWNKVVQGLLLGLRRVLGPDAIETTSAGYRLTVPPSNLDRCRFTELIDRAQMLAADEPTAVQALIDEARRLWRGAPYEDLASWPDAIGAANLMRERRRALDELQVTSLLAAERVDDAVAIGRQLVADEPFDEHRATILARALYRAGRPVDALRTVQDAAARLRDELGLDAGPELAELELALLRHDTVLLGGSRSTPAGSPQPRRVEPVPADTWFVGREDEIAEVEARLGKGRVTTIAGPGGVGKTALARQVANRASMEGRAVALISLDELDDNTDSVPAAIALTLGCSAPGVDPLKSLLEFLADRHVVVVLDGCEHVREQVAAAVEAIVATCAGVELLATSRRPLDVGVEEIVRIGGLPLADAVVLFSQRSARRGVFMRVEGHEDISSLCQRLEGLPLAIELAAARSVALSTGEILQAIEDRYLLGSLHEGRSVRRRTLAEVFDWSYALLSRDERSVLERLSVFPGGATLSALDHTCRDAVGGPVVDAVAGLVDASVVERRVEPDGSSRFRLHPTTRSAALRLLEDHGAEASAEDALALRLGRPQTAAEMCAALSPYFVYTLDLDARALLEATAEACEQAGVVVPEVLGTLSMMRWMSGDGRGARELADLLVGKATDDSVAGAFGHHVLGLISGDTDHLQRAVRYADDSGRTQRAVGFRAPLVLNLASVSHDEALECAQTAWQLAASSGNPTNIASANLSAGVAELATDVARARAHIETARSIAASVGNNMLDLMSTVIGSMAPPAEPRDAAAAALDGAIGLSERGAAAQAAYALLRAAELFAELGDQSTAQLLAQTAAHNGLRDWHSVRTSLRLTSLSPSTETFPPMPMSVEAAVARARTALEPRS